MVEVRAPASAAATETEPFGNRLRRLRVRAGMSREDLADRSGVSVPTILALELGRRRQPHPHTLDALARVICVTAEDRAELLEAALPMRASPQPPLGAAIGSPTPRPRSNLPAPRLDLIGREVELARVYDSITSSGVRLVTLTGIGGVGKTSLALGVAQRARAAFSDDVWLIELAPVAAPELVPQVVADVLGVPESPGQSAMERLRAHLATRAALMTLDNCEHLLDACAQLAEALLDDCPNMRILATSREPLLIRGEQQVRLAPLATELDTDTSVDPAEPSPAVQLFMARAQHVTPDFALTVANLPIITRVCTRLDGLPLAIELAAARTRTLAPEQILERLEHRFALLVGGSRVAPARHQTLHAALDWSYALLSEPERVVLRRLSVFAGDCDLEAAEAVCADSVDDRAAVLDRLGQLVDKSLVVVDIANGAARYGLLETVRAYAAEQLASSEQPDAVRAHHAAWYLALAEHVDATGRLVTRPVEDTSEHSASLARLQGEEANLRAALQWSLETRDAATGLRLGAALAGFWYVRGRYAEGLGWLRQLLAVPDAARPSPLRANVLAWAGDHAYCLGDHALAEALLGEGQAVAEQVGDEATRALCLQFQGNVARATGNLARARTLYEEGLALHCRLGDRGARLALAHILVGFVDIEQDRPADAAAHAQHAMTLYRELRNTWGISRAVYLFGRSAQAQGDLARARALFQESLELQRHLDDRQGLCLSLLALADTAIIRSDTVTASDLLNEALTVARDAGDRLALARAVEGAVRLAANRSADGAVRLASFAEALRESLNASPYPQERQSLHDALAPSRQTLTAEIWHRAWDSGREMRTDEAVASALQVLATAGSTPPVALTTQTSMEALTAREREVAQLVLRGRTDRQIAGELGISPRTAGLHVRRVLAKLELRSRWQIGDRAAAMGWGN
jgi:predicted ATPase/DNA-binding CsgD family transcriptional regulator/transcriptional regulator with XRE-family HTH domain